MANSSSIQFSKIRKSTKTFDLIGCSHSLFRKWIIHQFYGDMDVDKIYLLGQLFFVILFEKLTYETERDV